MKKKLRGKKRRLKSMLEQVVKATEAFPKPHRDNDFWHFHLPTPRLVEPTFLFRYGAQALLDRAEWLRQINPTTERHRVVVLSPTTPGLNQIIVFFDENGFEKFLTRNRNSFNWSSMPPQRSICQRYGLAKPDGVQEIGFLSEESEASRDEIWILGNFDYPNNPKIT